MAEVTTNAGKFVATDGDYTANASNDGVAIKVTFKPGKGVDAKKFGMVQMVTSVNAGNPTSINPTIAGRSIPAGEAGHGAHIDQAPSNNNPLYAVEGTQKGATSLSSGNATAPWGEHGYHYKEGTTEKSKDAWLYDTPRLPGAGNNSSQKFETTCLAFEGAQSGTYYGSVSWGWEKDGSGAFKKLPLTLVSAGAPSAIFNRAAEIWNKGTSGGEANIALPTTGASAAATPPAAGGGTP